MEQKTKLDAAPGRQEIIITRTFDLPVHLLFKAYTEPKLVEQWMGNKVLKMENHAHGSYRFETTDQEGNVLFRANGSIHKIMENKNITRTFEMENTGFPVQLEFLDFQALSADTSLLTMTMVFRSVADRDNLLQLPFSKGISHAHNQLEKTLRKLI